MYKRQVLVTTADGGKIETKYVTAGTYVIREVSTLPGYLLDTKERYFTVDEEGFIFESDSEGRPLDEDCAKSDTCLLYTSRTSAPLLPEESHRASVQIERLQEVDIPLHRFLLFSADYSENRTHKGLHLLPYTAHPS